MRDPRTNHRQPAPVFRAGGGHGAAVTAPLLVSTDAFSPRYDLDRATGKISRASHALVGTEITDTILVLPAPKGGVAAGWSLYALKQDGIAPAALVFTTVNPVFVQGAVHAAIPILHGFSVNLVTTLHSADIATVDPAHLELRLETA